MSWLDFCETVEQKIIMLEILRECAISEKEKKDIDDEIFEIIMLFD